MAIPAGGLGAPDIRRFISVAGARAMLVTRFRVLQGVPVSSPGLTTEQLAQEAMIPKGALVHFGIEAAKTIAAPRIASGQMVDLSLTKFVSTTVKMGASATVARGIYLTGDYVARTPTNEIVALLTSSNQASLSPQLAQAGANAAKGMMHNAVGQYAFVFCAGSILGAGAVYAIKPKATIREVAMWGAITGGVIVLALVLLRYFGVILPTKVD